MTEKVICPICKSEAEAINVGLFEVLGFVAKLTVNLRLQIAHWQCTKTQRDAMGGRSWEREGQSEGYSGDLATDYHLRF